MALGECSRIEPFAGMAHQIQFAQNAASSQGSRSTGFPAIVMVRNVPAEPASPSSKPATPDST